MLLRTASINLSCNYTAFECYNVTIRKARVGSREVEKLQEKEAIQQQQQCPIKKKRKLLRKHFTKGHLG